jgi:hypothetical protein
MKLKWLKILLIMLPLFLCWSAELSTAQEISQRQYLVYFEGTDYELHVYKISGKKPGNTLMIIGGIQGNEPGGYLSADLYTELSLLQGNLIVVPRANFLSIIKNTRGVNRDMNRSFAGPRRRFYEDEVVAVLKRLMAESTLLLNLHDGSGFYCPTFLNARHNPKRYGQSIISDTDKFYSHKLGRAINLKELAERVIARVNPLVKNSLHCFHFNNHRTVSPDTLHAEQRYSATFYAITKLGIPAFGIETSKDIDRADIKVRYQTMIINEFMREFGIIPEHPGIHLEPPKLKYIIVELNSNYPLVLKSNQTLRVNPGDIVKVTHVETNYERGISVDVIGTGGYNDFRRRFQVLKPAIIKIYKDGKYFDQVKLALHKENKSSAPVLFAQADSGQNAKKRWLSTAALRKMGNTQEGRLGDHKNPYLQFTLITGGQRHRLNAGEVLEIVLGDILEIESIDTNMADLATVKVNFKGFVGDEHGNTGEDRGYRIDTAKDLMKKYSIDKKGRRYRIVAKAGKRKLGHVEIKLADLRVSSLVLSVYRKPPVKVKMGERLKVKRGGTIQIFSAEDSRGRDLGGRVKVNFLGFLSGPDGEDRDFIIPLDSRLIPCFSIDKKGNVYPIRVTVGPKELGRVFVELQ